MSKKIIRKLLLVFMVGLIAHPMAYAGDKGKKHGNKKEMNPALFMGPGPVVSISESYASLPVSIKAFIPKHFNKSLAKSIEKKTFENEYEIELNNGYELKFSATGNWRKVEAPDKKVISSDLLRSLLPVNTYRYLVENKVEKKVKQISFDPRKGYKVELKKHRYDELYFNPAGVYLYAED